MVLSMLFCLFFLLSVPEFSSQSVFVSLLIFPFIYFIYPSSLARSTNQPTN